MNYKDCVHFKESAEKCIFACTHAECPKKPANREQVINKISKPIITGLHYEECSFFKDDEVVDCGCDNLACPKNTSPSAPIIKDSGERTKFSTGAVRDMHAGKGRMDLLPVSGIIELSKHCEAGAIKYGEHNVDKGIPQHSLIDSALRHLFKYLRGDKDENHLVAALWNIAWAVNQEVEKPEMIDLPNR